MPKPTEWTYASDLKEWINQVIEKIHTPFSQAKVEEIEEDQTRADVLIYTPEGVHTIISVKRPDYNPFDEQLRQEAKAKAKNNGARYYMTHNVNVLALWDGVTGELIEQFALTYIQELEAYQNNVSEIQENLEDVFGWYTQRLEEGRSPRPLDKSIAEILQRHIKGIINETPLISHVVEHVAEDDSFRKKFDKWVLNQGWEEASNTDEAKGYTNTLAHQFLYTFINKVIFYYVLRTQYDLPTLEIPPDSSSDFFYRQLDMYFSEAKSKTEDYETVFDANFVDTLPLPSSTINSLLEILDYLKSFDYGDIEYDIIGKVFEHLINEEQRHLLGQFFTGTNIVDLILGFCLRDSDSFVLDPGAGSGTFLIRSYYRLKQLDSFESHSSLLNQIWGIDIARFPAHLSTINLAIRNLSSSPNYPNVVAKDFFDVEGTETTVEIGLPGKQLDLEFEKSQEEVETLDSEKLEREIPVMDAVVGNPPYTRHEELHESLYGENYKTEKLQKRVNSDFMDLDLSERAGIYAYFIPHGMKFLKREGGRLGFVTLRQWLDVRYGEGLKDFLLNNSLVLTIIESKAERWFEDPQMLPIIMVLERNPNPSNSENWVKFVQLKEKLEDLFPAVQDIRDKLEEQRRWDAIDEFTDSIEDTDQSESLETHQFKDRKIKISEEPDKRAILIKQEQLKGEEKWGKYLNAPSGYFKILDENEDIITPIRNLDEVHRGVKTGANKFFCLKNAGNPFHIKESDNYYLLQNEEGETEFRIEKEYVEPGVTKIKPYKTISLTEPDDLILNVDMSKEEMEQKGLELIDYIEWGERPIHTMRGVQGTQGFNENKTCGDRSSWYALPIDDERHPPLSSPMVFWNRHIVFFNSQDAVMTNCQHEIYLKEEVCDKALAAILNSTFGALMMEFAGRYIENRDQTISNQVSTTDFRSLPVVDPRKLDQDVIKKLENALDRMSDRKIKPIYEDIKEEDRYKLDKIVFEDILGVTSENTKKIRQATGEIFRDRVERFS